MLILVLNMNSEGKDKTIVGYALLIVGLCLMGYSIASLIGVFTSGDVPIEILHAEGTDTTTEMSYDPKEGNVSMPMDLSQVIEPMFPIFNVMGWLAIAFFIVAAGGRVARIGIQMLKATLPDVKIIKSEIKSKAYKEEVNMKTEEHPKKEKKRFFRR